MNVLQHTRNERNPSLKQNRPDRSYRDTLLSLTLYLQLFSALKNGIFFGLFANIATKLLN